jgi:hypothetical protein
MSEERDLIERLEDPNFRGAMLHLLDWTTLDLMHVEAVSEITRLRREVERLSDSVDGLKSDLFEAVSVAYNRGAVEWGFLNYRSWIDRIEANSRANAERANLKGE